jgi:hypothetical protein
MKIKKLDNRDHILNKFESAIAFWFQFQTFLLIFLYTIFVYPSKTGCVMLKCHLSVFVDLAGRIKLWDLYDHHNDKKTYDFFKVKVESLSKETI